VIPQPFQTPSTTLSLPADQKRAWSFVPVEEVQVGDTVVDVGLVLDIRSRPVIGCINRIDMGSYDTECWLEPDHEGDCLLQIEAVAKGRVCWTGIWRTLIGPEVEKEFKPHGVARAFQLTQRL